jgi:hypothetical protein
MIGGIVIAVACFAAVFAVTARFLPAFMRFASSPQKQISAVRRRLRSCSQRIVRRLSSPTRQATKTVALRFALRSAETAQSPAFVSWLHPHASEQVHIHGTLSTFLDWRTQVLEPFLRREHAQQLCEKAYPIHS